MLVIKRHYHGRDHAGLPGGSVEAGESFEQAAARELREESTLDARVMCQLLVGEHNGREARYFLMTDVVGTPELSGPELEDHCSENSFEFLWASKDDLGATRTSSRVTARRPTSTARTLKVAVTASGRIADERTTVYRRAGEALVS